MKSEKKSVKRKSLKWKEIYAKCNHNKYSQITNITDELTINSNVNNFIKNNAIVLIAILIFIILLLLYTFRNNLILVLYSLLFFILMFIFIIYYNTYKLKLKKDELDLTISLQKYEIPYNDLINVYLSKIKTRFFGFPIYAYNLNIIYSEQQVPMLLTLPVVMLNKQSVIKFFNCIQTKQLKSEDDEIKEREKSNREVLKIIIIVTIIVIIISLLISYVIYNSHK